MTYPYGMKGTPAAGRGLGGLPRRKSASAASSGSLGFTRYDFNDTWYGTALAANGMAFQYCYSSSTVDVRALAPNGRVNHRTTISTAYLINNCVLAGNSSGAMVAGINAQDNGTYAVQIVYLDASGVQKWRKLLGQLNQSIRAAVMDEAGNVYLYFRNGAGDNSHITKLDSTGAVVWQKYIASDATQAALLFDATLGLFVASSKNMNPDEWLYLDRLDAGTGAKINTTTGVITPSGGGTATLWSWACDGAYLYVIAANSSYMREVYRFAADLASAPYSIALYNISFAYNRLLMRPDRLQLIATPSGSSDYILELSKTMVQMGRYRKDSPYGQTYGVWAASDTDLLVQFNSYKGLQRRPGAMTPGVNGDWNIVAQGNETTSSASTSTYFGTVSVVGNDTAITFSASASSSAPSAAAEPNLTSKVVATTTVIGAASTYSTFG